MAFAALAVAVALSAPPPAAPPPIDFDAAERSDHERLDSPYLRDMTTVAMALPYKYGVTQMPCRARELEPLRGWVAAREPSGRIEWVRGASAKARWSGIYGTCFIESPVAREQAGAIERTALECECNGWLPKGVEGIPLP